MTDFSATRFEFENAPRFAQPAASIRTGQDTVFIDVGSRRIDANVSRDGLPVGIHQINPEILGELILDRPITRFTIVSQSVAAGTPVAVGTSIDVTITQPGRLPVGVVAGTLAAFRERPMAEAFQGVIGGNPQARRIIARAAAGPLSGEDEQAVRQIFEAQNAPITDEPGNDIAAAVATLNAINTFGGS